MKKKAAIIIAIIMLLPLAGLGTFYFCSPEIYNCVFVGCSGDFHNAGNNIFISTDTPAGIRDSVFKIIKEADKRVSSFWESKREASPAIIFCYTEDQVKDFSKTNLVLTYKTPVKSFIIFCRGTLDPDIVSHELLHTEFCERTGYFNNVKVPVWFDEGLAMQVDMRKEYSEQIYLKLKDSAGIGLQMRDISTPGDFYSGDLYSHFVFARHEVKEWMRKNGKEGLFKLVKKIKDGKEFSPASF